METKNQLSHYIDTFIVVLLGALFVGFPLVFTSLTTDAFTIPKQLLLGVVVLVGLLTWGIKMVIEKSVRIKQTPFNLPILLLVVFSILSAGLSVNRYDALVSVVPLFFAATLYFIIVNTVRTPKAFGILVSVWVATVSVLSVYTLLSFAKVYVLPFSYAKVQNFTPVGSYLDLAIILLLTLPVAIYFVMPLLRGRVKDITPASLAFGAATLIIAIGLAVSVYGLATKFTPRILPFESGFQTAFASISQDTGRTFQSFLLGSGYGTYSVDFSRFKQPSFNANNDIWNLQFIRSSSFMLELLATTGVLGLAAFVALLVMFIRSVGGEKKSNPLYIALFIGFALTFVLPFSIVTITVFFMLLGLFVATQQYPDVKWHFTALTEGIFGNERKSPIFAILLLIVFSLIAATLAYYEYKFLDSDVTFQKSLVALSNNNGSGAYDLQNKAMVTFPYRDFYHRSFSQLNLALANSLASSQPKDSTPSAQAQQNIYTLIQQSINAGRSAVAVSPQNALNWQNLSSIYRSLIGFGENAESFAILAQQQAVALDPSNPQQYIILGGLYYQLQQWDAAARQFQVAANLKPDFANAYYNLGHAFESKGELQAALVQYQTVRQLVGSDKDNLATISKEIEALEKKIGEAAAKDPAQQQQQAQAQQQRPAQNQPNLEVNRPATQLPQQETKVQLPPPTAATPSANPQQ